VRASNEIEVGKKDEKFNYITETIGDMYTITIKG